MAKKLNEIFGQPPSRVDKEKVVNWLRPRWARQLCPICGMARFIIGDDLIQPITYPETGLASGAGYPMVMLICDTCGHTLFFSAVKMGLVESPSLFGNQ